ncbi:hypothetical protein F441_23058 [Phytophthora nicotianae CJ01A1]|uniref:Uncharacterized protein n=1 Tax=Phytophthora nicotianae CJ01A1 TaxID=1317063 RepID=W2VQ28_PHYNI|nr:hypothetical protein F441_23058 [Phytophthora nicotianae CJ01A1]
MLPRKPKLYWRAVSSITSSGVTMIPTTTLMVNSNVPK